MKTLEILYWVRLALGITAALLCTVYGLATNTVSITNITINTFINGLSIALIIYIISYFIIKRITFTSEMDSPRKLVTTGIGIYIISWIVFWTLLYTIIAETTA